VGFEPTISAGERPQTYALDRAVTGTGIFTHKGNKKEIYHILHIEYLSVFSLAYPVVYLNTGFLNYDFSDI
jgi:hypothetical protein